MRQSFLALFTIALLVAATNAKADDGGTVVEGAVPDLLRPYVSGNRPMLGDYRWFRGKFPGASDEQEAVTTAARNFNAECYARHLADVRQRLLAMDVVPVEQGQYSIVYKCSAFTGISLPSGTTWAQFDEAARLVRPLMRGLIFASEFMLASAEDESTLAAQIRTRVLADQLIRNALGATFRRADMFAEIDELQRRIAGDMLGLQMAKIDAANSEYLRGLIASVGWPESSKVGEDTTHYTWLLAQHADADPALQLHILRQMEPMIEKGDASARDYAYLYDRVMLKLVGKQRYATQFECRDGKRVPQPLEADIASADRYRTATGIGSVAEDAKRLEQSYGSCPTSQ